MPTQTRTKRRPSTNRTTAVRRQSPKRTGGGAQASRVNGFGRRAERSLLIPLGAAATLRDKVTETARTYRNVSNVRREFDKFERRGARLLSRGERAAKRRQRELARDVRSARRSVQERLKSVR